MPFIRLLKVFIFSLGSILALVSCGTSTPSQQAFPLLTINIERQTRAHRQVVKPVLVHSVKPEYPEVAAAGSVWAVMKVNPQGQVAEVKIVGKCPELYEAAIRSALLQWRFKSGSIDGNRATFPMPVKITFTRGPGTSDFVGNKAPLSDGISFLPKLQAVSAIFPDLVAQMEAQRRQGKKIDRPRLLKASPPGRLRSLEIDQVWSAFIINAKGKVQNLHLLSQVPKRIQDSIARDMSSWEFEPAKLDGRPIDFPVAMKFVYNTR